MKRRQIFICILVSFVVWGLICYGLSPAIAKLAQDESFSFTLSKKIPLNDKGSDQAPLRLWQVNESNGVFAQVVARTSFYRVPIKSTRGVWNALYSHPENTYSDDTSFHLIDRPNTAFKVAGGQTYHYLDMPPPPHLNPAVALG